MRNLPICLIAAAAVTGSASAQAIFEYYPGEASATSRGNVSTTTVGEIHTAFHSTVNRGLGDTGGVCQLNGIRTVLQDQVGATLGTWRYFIRSGTEATGPGTTAADVIANTGTINLPASTATGPVAWTMTSTFTTPLQVPCTQFWSIGVELPAGLSTDYVSVHTAYNTLNHQHPSAEDISWQILSNATAATHPPTMRTFRIGAIVNTAIQVGNVVATETPPERFGVGGHFPDTTQVGATSQGLAFKVTHPGGATATAYVFMSLGFNTTPFTIPGLGNTGYMDLATILPFALAVGPADGSVIPFAAPGMDILPSAGGLTAVMQALVLDPTTPAVDFTNAFGVVLN